VEGKEDINWKRTSTFAAFGFGYMGIAQYGLYVKLMAGRWFPQAASFAAKPLRAKLADGKGLRDLFSQVLIDQVLHVPFVFFPCYYATKVGIMGDGELSAVIPTAWKKWKTNFVEDVKASWTIWIPCNIINFGFMPMHCRIPFMAFCSMGFCVVLSSMRGGKAGRQSQVSPEASQLQASISSLQGLEQQEVGSEESLFEQVRAADGEEPALEGVSESSFFALMHRLGVRDADEASSIQTSFKPHSNPMLTPC